MLLPRITTPLGTIFSAKNVAQLRFLSLSPQMKIKQIEEQQEGKNIIISAKIIDSDRVPYMLPQTNPACCSVCSSGLDIKHTDVLILSQFVRSDGCMLPRRITGLCRMQQKRIGTMVTMAHKAGLMSILNPSYSKKDPKKRYQWKKFNKYFDESTIEV